MHSFCIKNLRKSKAGKRNKRGFSEFFEKVIKFFEYKKRALSTWAKISKQIKSISELKRLNSSFSEIMKLAKEWFYSNNPLDECKKSANIFHKIVETFGVYFYKSLSEDQNKVCDEKCAYKLVTNHFPL